MSVALAGRLTFLVAIGFVFVSAPVRGDAQQDRDSSPAASAASFSAQTVLSQYCVTCHNEKLRTGGLALDRLDLKRLHENADVWEKVIRKLQVGVMPPAGRPRPDQATYHTLISWLESELDRAGTADPNPGRTATLHRLNRAEYQNAIRDLLALDIDAVSLLPGDPTSYGFDNIGGILKISPALMEQYVRAARTVSRQAVGTVVPKPVEEVFRYPPSYDQRQHIDGLPLGTRGGALIRFNFPADAEYVVRIGLAGGQSRDAEELEVSLDGERIKLFAIKGRQPEGNGEVRFPVTAGPHDLVVTFVQKAAVEVEQDRLPFMGAAVGMPTLGYVRLAGPFNAKGHGDTPSRRRIFVCQPPNADAEERCARSILSTLARRGYRRPVTDADVSALMRAYTAARADAGFDGGIEAGLAALLVNPEFLFRVTTDPRNVRPGENYRIGDIELASRLSFFLWSSIPDDELLDVAERGLLKDPRVLEREVRRMIADPRSEALTKNFAGQWLQLRNLAAVQPSSHLYPNFDESLRRGFLRETELFFDSIVREDRSVLELLTADYTFLNERVAKHYGIAGIKGDKFRRVSLAGTQRRGVLGHGSILMLNARAIRTSPVLRGKWILENVLGVPPPPPPPNVPALREKDRNASVELPSMRERMAEHRANPACASCHAMIDPMGFALENFDAVGKWREIDESFAPIDVAGTFLDGTKFGNLEQFRQALLRDQAPIVTTFLEKLFTYALGRGAEPSDMPAIRAIRREAAAQKWTMSSLILGVVRSAPFQMRRSEVAAAAGVQ